MTLGGLPERLLIDRRDGSLLQPGARGAARVRRIERGLGLAFLDLGEAGEAVLSLSPNAPPLVEGGLIEVEVAAPARRGKTAALRRLGPATGEPGLRAPALDVETRLQAFAPGEPVTRGPSAREAADAAEEAALAVEHVLPGGGRLWIEPTRGLVAVDVDLAAFASTDPGRARARVNRAALDHAARLLRLKGLGGLVVIDLAGGSGSKGGDGAALIEHARAAFAPDQPGVIVGGVSRFGVLELAVPWRATPTAELLNDADGRPSASTVALRLARVIEREAGPGARVAARCAPEVATAFETVAPALRDRIGPRFTVTADPTLARERVDVRPC